MLKNPSTDEFHKVLDSWQPNIVYLQGEHLSNDEVGSLVWGGFDLSSLEAISGLFSTTLPTAVCNFLFFVLSGGFVLVLPFRASPLVGCMKDFFFF